MSTLCRRPMGTLAMLKRHCRQDPSGQRVTKYSPSQSRKRRRLKTNITERSIPNTYPSSVPHLSHHLSHNKYNKLPLKQGNNKKTNNKGGIGRMGQIGQIYHKLIFQ